MTSMPAVNLVSQLILSRGSQLVAIAVGIQRNWGDGETQRQKLSSSHFTPSG